MKRLRKLCDEGVVEVPEDIIIDILHRLPSKSLARFKSVSKCWREEYLRPLIGFFYQHRVTRLRPQIRFFFSSTNQSSSRLVLNNRNISLDNLCCSDSSEMVQRPCPVSDMQLSVFLKSSRHIVDESFNFLDGRMYIVASSKGFLLCNRQKVNKQRIYYVYNPVMRQCLALPKTKICIKSPAIGFICKVNEHGKDVINFNIVRYSLPSLWGLQFNKITIESFSSETNMWTMNFLKLNVPLGLCPSLHRGTSSASVIDGVFCWLDQHPQIIAYDSVHKCMWALELPQEIVAGNDCFLGTSGEELYLALNDRFGSSITVWYLHSNICIRDAVWVRKYVANVTTTLVQCPQANTGLASSRLILVQNMIIHPAVSHIVYLVVRGKVFSYNLETDIAEFVYDFGEPCWKTRLYTLFSYEWDQWPHLL